MNTHEKPRLLINLPPTFFTHPLLKPHFSILSDIADTQKTSHNTQAELLPDLRKTDAVMMWAWPDLDEKVLDQCPELRFVGQINTSRTTARCCLQRGIAISETRHCWSPAVAEMALGLILCGLRRISDYHTAMRKGEETWINDFPADIDPRERELTGKSVGIVGFGGIGQRLAQFLNPFDVQLRIYDPFLPTQIATQYNARQVSLMELILTSEVIVLCAANSEEARSLFDHDEIEALRSGCVLVNVGRSMLIDMPALQKRLERGDITAMLDVFDQEPLEINSPFRRLSNTFLTPHRAGGILASVERALMMLTDDFKAHLQGLERKYTVTEAMLTSFPG